jgi:dihydrofolate reductase
MAKSPNTVTAPSNRADALSAAAAPEDQIQTGRMNHSRSAINIAVIVAMSEDGTIGDKGKIPWHISADLHRFKRLTMDHPIIMGRRTYESIGKPLPGRTNIVLTRSANFTAPPGVLAFASLDDALEHCRRQNAETVFIIGGGKVYEAALPLADKLFVTKVHRRIPGDTKFPKYDHRHWSEIARENAPGCSFVEYLRR